MPTTRVTAEVSQEIPRIEMPDLDPDLARALMPRVARLGYLGEFFKVMAHQPESLIAFMDFTEALKVALPDRLTELVALTVAQAANNAYERHQHERLSEKLGFSQAWIGAVTALDPDRQAELTPVDRAVQHFVLTALRQYGQGACQALGALVTVVGPKVAVALLLLVGRYLTHTLVVNALELAPPVPSIFVERGA